MVPSPLPPPRGFERLDVRLGAIFVLALGTLLTQVWLERRVTEQARGDITWLAAATDRRSELARLLSAANGFAGAERDLDRAEFARRLEEGIRQMDRGMLALRNGDPAAGLPAPRDPEVRGTAIRLESRWRISVGVSLAAVLEGKSHSDALARASSADLVGWRLYANLDTLVVAQEAAAAARLKGRQSMAMLLRFAAALAIVSALTVVARSVRRIRRLAAQTQEVADELHQPVEIEGKDDIAVLASALESLRQQVLALLDREGRFFAVSRTLLAIVDYSGVIRRTNPAWEAVTGFQQDQLAGRNLAEFIHPDDKRFFHEAGRSLASGTGESIETELRLVRSDGETAHLAWSAVPSPGERLLYCVGHDITSRLRAEEDARRADRMFASLVSSAPDAILLFDASRTILHANGRALEMFGLDRWKLVGCDLGDLIADPDRAELLEMVERVLATGSSPHGIPRAFLRAQHASAGPFPVEAALSAVYDDAGDVPLAGIAVLRDRSHTEALEAQLRHAQKMEAVGRLAGGVAHDFNNLLTVILAHSSGDLDDGPDQRAVSLAEITRAAERAAALTRQLLSFSRRQVLVVANVDVHEVIDGIVRLLTRLLGADIQVHVDKKALHPIVRADVGQLEQALVNMAVNARDAMPGGGRLTFATAIADCPDAADAPAGKAMLRLTVTDTGTGMDEATRARVFEPFFTTKPQGTGTGLGLATVYGSVRQMGGMVEVESAPGKGSAFHIYLPLADAPVLGLPRAAGVAGPGGNEERRRGTVLVVEDDAQVRAVTRGILAREGYEVLEASGPEEVAVLLPPGTPAPDLAILDVVLGQVTGPEIGRELKKRYPELPLLFVSGYADEMLIQRGILEEGHPLLKKPFTKQDLRARIHSLLDRAGPDGRGAAPPVARASVA